MLVPCGMIVLLFTLASWITYIFVAGVLAFGLVVNIVLDVARRRKWCEFRPQTYCKISNIPDAGGGAAGDETPCTESLGGEIQLTSQGGPRHVGGDDEMFVENSEGIMT